MVNIYKYLNELNLNEILSLLESNNDIDNVMIVLQMFDINTLVDIEKLKEKIKALTEEDDDLLSVLDEKQKELQKLQEEQSSLERKRNKTTSAIQSILNQPMKFWESNEIDAFANSLLGTIIVPKTKEQRSLLATNIINGILIGKNKNLNINRTDDRISSIDKIKQYKSNDKNLEK
jgi:predicted nuclease with TOPRIM domain